MKMLGDIRNPKLMYVKGGLFVVAGLLSGLLLLLESPSLRTAVLLVLTVWCFCRAYYFAFYVVGKYIDPKFRFAGLGDFVRYLLRRRRK